MNEFASVLRRVASIGPFFDLSTSTKDAAWQPFSELLTDPEVLSARITATRDALAVHGGAVEWRVAASLAQLNLAARVLSPVLGCAVVAGVLPVVSPELLWWQPVLGGAFPLALPEAHGVLCDDDPVRAARAGVAPILELLVDATHRVGGLSTQIAWGNVDSAAAAALGLIGRATGRPAGPAYRRSTCCLFYRVAPDAGLCGDCVLDSRPGG